jgi:hypothetical protein
MAKKRDITISNLKVTDKGCELAAKIGFALKMDNSDVAVDHVMNINFSMTLMQLVMIALKGIVIDAQKIMRVMGTHAKVRTWTGNVLGYSDVYPSTRAVRVSVARDMTPEEIRGRCKTDKAFRASLMAELEAMEDEDTAERAEDDGPDMYEMGHEKSPAQVVDIKAA